MLTNGTNSTGTDENKENKRFDAAVLSYLFTTRTVQRLHKGNDQFAEKTEEIESRVDYIADRMGVPTGRRLARP